MESFVHDQERRKDTLDQKGDLVPKENKRRTKDTANPTDIVPPQEQDRHMEPESCVTPEG